MRTRLWQKAQRRGYASGGAHGAQKASSDLPWIIGATAVTVPSCAYLLQPNPNKGHGHGHDGEGHGEHGEHEEGEEGENDEGQEEHEESSPDDQETGDGAEGKEGEESSEGAADQSESGGGQDPEKSDDSDSDGGEQQDTPDTSDDEGEANVPHEKEGGGDVKGVQFKGATSGGTKDGEQGDTRKHIPDAKGANKKRIESDYGLRQGVDDEGFDRNEDGTKSERATASKPPGSKNMMSGKQEGISNTDTKHSTDISNSPEKSKKGEGSPETAKSKGTVDPSRPQAEMRQK
ncbi:hypothetical protein MMC24_007497 [Lignoscripta atroalba]|nr:hypothetical protein [Lignoscripta atroalba]